MTFVAFFGLGWHVKTFALTFTIDLDHAGWYFFALDVEQDNLSCNVSAQRNQWFCMHSVLHHKSKRSFLNVLDWLTGALFASLGLSHMPHFVTFGFLERSRLIKCTTSQAWLKPHQPREIATLFSLLRPWPNLQIQGQPEDRKGKRVANLALSLQLNAALLSHVTPVC